ncbi:hypothetical protein [Psychrobacillus sp. FSL H8-0487]|uniref:hypothetical protein n=1 Tax=Psychrobacillus sp. FSL H8-0487 TaxID=2921391 RepID=UPI0030FCAD05
MVKSLFLYLLLVIVISLPFIISSNFGFVTGGPPGIVGLLNTIAFLIVWLAVSMMMGYKLKRGFNLIILIYWGMLALVFFPITNTLEVTKELIPLVLVFLISPLYGVSDYLSTDEIVFIGIPICVFLCFLFFFGGKTIKNRKLVQN